MKCTNLRNIYRLTPREFNSYGSRRGNDEIMSRGTFANIRLVNKLVPNPGPKTVHIPSSDEVFRFTKGYLEFLIIILINFEIFYSTIFLTLLKFTKKIILP